MLALFAACATPNARVAWSCLQGHNFLYQNGRSRRQHRTYLYLIPPRASSRPSNERRSFTLTAEDRFQSITLSMLRSYRLRTDQWDDCTGFQFSKTLNAACPHFSPASARFYWAPSRPPQTPSMNVFHHVAPPREVLPHANQFKPSSVCRAPNLNRSYQMAVALREAYCEMSTLTV